MRTDQRRRWVMIGRALFLCIVVGLAAGCPAVIEYQPDEARVMSLGAEGTKKRLEKTLYRAVNPRIDAVDINEDFLRYRLNATTVQISVNFGSVARIGVFNNHYVFMRDRGNHVIARILFATAADAKQFADLFMSLQNYYASQKA